MALKNKKEKDFSEWFTEIVSESGAKLADVRYGVQGFVAHRPWAVKIMRTYEQWIEADVESDGYEPILLPVLVPKKNIEKEKEHVQFSPELFWVERMGDSKLDEPLYMRPTGESQIYPMYSLWIRSWKDLPFKKYQSRISVYRAESTTRPFLRGREFMFFETHAVYKNHEGVLKQVTKDMKTCEAIVRKKLGIPFFFFKRPEWDKFAGAVDTFAADTLMPDGKVNQIASTHDLGQKFAKAYDIAFLDEKEQKQFGWQTTFGPGIWRIMAALVGIHGDNNGLVLPFEIAPTQIVILPVFFDKDKKAVDKKCKELEKILSEKFRVKYDSSENTAGWKFNEWEMLGVPIRLEIGPREIRAKKVTLVRRDDRKKITVSEKSLEKEIEKAAAGLLKSITKKAELFFDTNIRDAESFDKLKTILSGNRGFAKVNLCSVEIEGQACADKVQAETDGGKVRGTLYGKNEKATGKCVACGKPAKVIVYVAKSY